MNLGNIVDVVGYYYKYGLGMGTHGYAIESIKDKIILDKNKFYLIVEVNQTINVRNFIDESTFETKNIYFIDNLYNSYTVTDSNNIIKNFLNSNVSFLLVEYIPNISESDKIRCAKEYEKSKELYDIISSIIEKDENNKNTNNIYNKFISIFKFI